MKETRQTEAQNTHGLNRRVGRTASLLDYDDELNTHTHLYKDYKYA